MSPVACWYFWSSARLLSQLIMSFFEIDWVGISGIVLNWFSSHLSIKDSVLQPTTLCCHLLLLITACRKSQFWDLFFFYFIFIFIVFHGHIIQRYYFMLTTQIYLAVTASDPGKLSGLHDCLLDLSNGCLKTSFN